MTVPLGHHGIVMLGELNILLGYDDEDDASHTHSSMYVIKLLMDCWHSLVDSTTTICGRVSNYVSIFNGGDQKRA